MLGHAGDKIGGTTEMQNPIRNVAYTARNLQKIICVDDEVYFFILSLSNDSKTAELFKIVTSLFHNALRAGNI